MPLPWDRFLQLQGAATDNWERLCREVVRRRYSAFGRFATRKNQPGVEFHVEVLRPGSELGEPGRHWAWQCRWYAPDAFRQSGRLTAAQRGKIEDAIEKSERHLHALTDWVLWTREPLNADDERWFDELEAQFKLHRLDGTDLEGLLSGAEATLRETWFGDLVMTADWLRRRHVAALAPVQARYDAVLHVATPVERDLTGLIHGPDHVEDLERRVEAEIALADHEVDRARDSSLPAVRDHLVALQAHLAELAADPLEGPVPDETTLAAAAQEADELRRRLRDERFPEARRTAAAALDLAAEGWAALELVAQSRRTSLVALLGGAGAGKTHLSAELSGPSESPRGVFILAREVPGTPHEDGLARAAGLTGRSGQDLIEAIDALGARLGRRVPLVVDGLNEADEPRAWRDVIARLRGLLPAYPNVLGLVTCRPSYADAILPEAVERLVLPGFQGVEEDAVNRYFTAYRIHARPNDLPWWPLNDPLLLSIFCRTVNPQRDRDVHVTELPTSLTEVLENYIDDVIARICDRMNIAYTADVRDPLLHLASAFFDRGVRELPRSEVRTLLGDQQRANFQASLQHQLESEEILGRDLLADTEQVLWNYDLVGGHLIAKAVLSRWTDPETELAQPEFLSGLDGHPLREDIVSALAGLLMPDGIELWRIVSGQPNVALIARVALPGLPSEMVSGRAVEAVVATFETDPDATLDSLESSTLVPGHPLNAQILDRLLTPLEVADRDLRWTEWVRRRADSLIPQLEQISRRLTTVPVDEELSDALVTWLSWLLTTTNRPLRDQAVHALYSFGLRHPESLFRRTEAMLDINDRSIAEGLMAAAYGVAMAAQEPGSDLIENVLAFADRVSESLLTDGATRPTTHWLIREYAFRLRQLAGWLRSGQLPDQATQPPLPAPAGEVSGFARDDPGWTAVDEAFMLDFSNYTIGRLVEDRGNYDNDHPEFIRITGEIRKRVADLGWTPERFGDLDGSIARLQETRGELDPAKTERYGKKYAWIGLYEAAGRLSDQSALPTDAGSSWRMADIVIDPSFPAPPPRIDHALPRWGDDYPADDAAWLASGVVDVPDQLLRPDVLNGVAGPWIALEGFFRPERDSIHRSIFCFVRGTLALGGWATVQNWIADHGVTNDTVPRVSGDYYTFGGEAPWSPTFDALATARDGTVKPHVEVLGGRSGGSEVELLSVDFSWESHHSVLNQSESLVLPSKAFALAAGLRGMRGTTSFSTANGEVGAQVVDTPDDWRGCVLYVREDLLRSYCRCRHGEYGWIAWGERQIQWDHAQPAPEWLRQLRATGADRFSRVTSLDELAS